MEASLIAVFAFGVVFIVTLLVLAIAFPEPTPFQYTVFRIVLALAAAGVAALIPGFMELNIAAWLKAGGAMAVFAIVYFYSPAQLLSHPVTGRRDTDILTLQQAWQGIRAPDPKNLDADMVHRTLNAMRVTARLWQDGNQDEKQLIREECWGPYSQWFIVLDSSEFLVSDGKPAKEHLDGLLRDVYKEMKSYG
jgi:hypothetical protein